MIPDKHPDLVFANFFFADIVGLSDPNMSTTLQLKKLKVLHDSVTSCESYKSVSSDDMISFPTGDGMCIGFLRGQDLPLLLALEFHEKLNHYNKGKLLPDMVRTRIGLHSGNCFTFSDIQNKVNVWGPGVIIARRIMDLGDFGHILLSSRMAEDLWEMSDKYRKIVKPVRDYTFKHDVPMLVYSATGENFGNSTPPQKNAFQKSKMEIELTKLQNTALYSNVDVSLTLKDTKTMLIRHKRTYHVTNISDEPISYILHGIGLDIEKKSINDLNIHCYDESGTEMKISSVNLDQPFAKEFSTQFANPVQKNQENKTYTLEYDVEEPKRFFENTFAIGCKKFSISFIFSNDSIDAPLLYSVDPETEKLSSFETKPTMQTSKNHTTITWKQDDVAKGEILRLEW